MEVIDEGWGGVWEGCVIPITPRSCQQWKRWTSEAVVLLQQQHRLYLSPNALSKDIKHSALCRPCELHRKVFCVQTCHVNNSIGVLMLFF